MSKRVSISTIVFHKKGTGPANMYQYLVRPTEPK
jgi:hypothetical protein